MSTERRLIRAVEDQLGIQKGGVKLTDSFIDDLDCDSLDAIEILMAIEEEFDVEIGESRYERAGFTVGDAVALVDSIK